MYTRAQKTLQTLFLIVAAVAAAFIINAFSGSLAVEAQSGCADPSGSTYGTVTMDVEIPASTTYRVWSRIQTESAGNNSFYLSIDDNICNEVVGDVTIPVDTWTWVDNRDGSLADKLDFSLSAGTHTVELVGREPSVKLDRVLFLSDTGCVPEGDGQNCVEVEDVTAPSVSVTNPAANTTVSGDVNIAANATDNEEVTSVEFLVDGTIVSTDNSSPFAATWDSAGVSDGQHDLTARAYDEAGNQSLSTPVTVTVLNQGAGSATITIEPDSGTFNVGDTINADIYIDTGTDEVDAAQVALLYDGDSIQYTGVDASSSAYGTAANLEELGGSVVIARGNTSPLTGKQLFATVQFEATETGSSASLSLEPSETIVARDGTELSETLGSANYTVADTTAPSKPGSLEVVSSNSSQIEISWNASTDDTAVAGYNVFRNGAEVATGVTGTSYTDTNVGPGTSYDYYVVAVDPSGNISQPSNTVSVTTSSKRGDINTDGTVNIQDLVRLLTDWNKSVSDADLNSDGIVNVIDLSILLAAWEG